ncbi:autotransporter domain-containing protein [Fusobacterium perfoetens]|uniref:autotransporter domain-containing protein n=1 Tax=Fusobacterium perfoetens TaxID=852 RepID=UPI001F416732|nr:autotransporter domain-containing protein [Fusobacterium perfoetens]MCF2625580.1 autotransporter domain-containing protein [Fusobacterium perfoetens]
MGKNYVENSLKRFLKRKVKITMGVVVSFLITGMVSFGAADKTVEITLENGEIKINQEIGILDKNNNTWTTDDIINVQDGNGIQITGENENFNIINNGSIFGNTENNTLLGNGIAIGYKGEEEVKTNIGVITNTGIISGEGLGEGSRNFSGNGIINVGGIIKEITNTGIISGNFSGNFLGNPSETYIGNGIINVGGIIKEITNTGIISGNSPFLGSGFGIYNDGTIEKIENSGLILGEAEGSGIYNPERKTIKEILNTGIILGEGSGEGSGNGFAKDPHTEEVSVENYGIISGSSKVGDRSGNGMITVSSINLLNEGIILGNKNSGEMSGNGLISIADDDKMVSVKNYGIIAGSNKAIEGVDESKITNYGLLISGDKIEAGDGGIHDGKEIINGVESDKTTARVVTSTELADKNKNENLIINVVGKEGTAFNIDSELTLSDSTINGYKNAVTLTGKDFTGNNVIVNAGENAFTGSTSKDTITLTGESIINGKIDLGAGEDELTINNTVQINKDLDGGADSDTLTFNSSSADNMNVLHNISNFENINVDSNITLFENIKISGAEKITIEDKGTLTLRVDGTKKDSDGKIIGHALHGNDGTIITSISPDKNGKLNINFIGGQNEEIISFGSNKLENVTVDFTNPLYMTKETSDKDSTSEIQVSVAENLDDFIGGSKQDTGDIDTITYEKLNKIYESMHSVDGLLPSEFAGLTDEKVGEFLKYLHDIFAENPYAYSSELSRKTMSMMKNLADRDLKPDYKEWAIYGGFTHVDGGTKDTFYGRGYYTYDVGSHTDHADTKINGGYFKAEYGKEKDLTTGIIFGGNNSETEIGASKVEGDSFYFGAYAKKYLNNFRFTLGAGFQHGDYKGDRTALGYGVTDTRKYSENYHDRGFNIYGNTKYSKELGNNFFFEPSVTLEYSYVDQDGVKEYGVLAIETDSKTFDYLSGTVNLDLRKNITSDTLTHSFISGVSYERMLSGYDSEYITGRIIGREKLGKDFDILVPEKEKDTLSLNLRYELETEKGLMFDVKGSYRFEHDNNDDEWIIGTGIGYKF